MHLTRIRESISAVESPELFSGRPRPLDLLIGCWIDELDLTLVGEQGRVLSDCIQVARQHLPQSSLGRITEAERLASREEVVDRLSVSEISTLSCLVPWDPPDSLHGCIHLRTEGGDRAYLRLELPQVIVLLILPVGVSIAGDLDQEVVHSLRLSLRVLCSYFPERVLRALDPSIKPLALFHKRVCRIPSEARSVEVVVPNIIPPQRKLGYVIRPQKLVHVRENLFSRLVSCQFSSES